MVIRARPTRRPRGVQDDYLPAPQQDFTCVDGSLGLSHASGAEFPIPPHTSGLQGASALFLPSVPEQFSPWAQEAAGNAAPYFADGAFWNDEERRPKAPRLNDAQGIIASDLLPFTGFPDDDADAVFDLAPTSGGMDLRPYHEFLPGTCPTQDATDSNRLQRLRDKNREAQARHRLRKRLELDEVQRRIKIVQPQLEATRARIRELQHAKHGLTERCNTAAQELLDFLARDDPGSSSVDGAYSRRRKPGTQTPQQCPVPPARFYPVGIFPLNTKMSDVHPPEDFGHMEPLSLDVLKAAVPELNVLRADPTKYMRQHMAAAAAERCAQVGDVCWMWKNTMLPVGEGASLAFSAHLGSAACVHSLALFFALSILQHAVLVDEMEILEKLEAGAGGADGLRGTHSSDSSSPNLANSQHTALRPTSTSTGTRGTHSSHSRSADRTSACGSEAPGNFVKSSALHLPSMVQGPDGSSLLCANLSVRCGDGSTMPLHDAAHALLTHILTQAGAELPTAVLQERCRQCLQFMDSMAAGYRNVKVEHPEPRRTDSRELNMLEAVRMSMNASAAVLRRLLPGIGRLRTGAPGFAGAVGPGGFSVRRAERARQVERIALEMDCQWHIGMAALFAFAPKRIRMLSLGHRLPTKLAYEVMEQMQLHLYKGVKLLTAQRASMATFWTQWCQSVRKMDEELGTVVKGLKRLPSLEGMPTTFVHSLMEAGAEVRRGRTGAGTRGSEFEAADGSHSWATELLGASPDATDRAQKLLVELQDDLSRRSDLHPQLFGKMKTVNDGWEPRQALRIHAELLDRGWFMSDTAGLIQMAADAHKRERLNLTD